LGVGVRREERILRRSSQGCGRVLRPRPSFLPDECLLVYPHLNPGLTFTRPSRRGTQYPPQRSERNASLSFSATLGRKPEIELALV
jgi:hypothetical protein